MSRAETILNIVGQIEERSPETVTEYRERLEAKLREVLNDTTIDEQRILTEAAIFADKVAVAEETVRLRSHFDQLKAFLSAEEPPVEKWISCTGNEPRSEYDRLEGQRFQDCLHGGGYQGRD